MGLVIVKMFVVAKECSSQLSRHHIELVSQQLHFFLTLVVYIRQFGIQMAGQN